MIVPTVSLRQGCPPQGGLLSPLLSNIILHELDVELTKYKLRYAGDALIHCEIKIEAENAER